MHHRVPENHRSHLIFQRRSTLQDQALKKIKFSLLQTKKSQNSLVHKHNLLEKERKVKINKLEHLFAKLRKLWDKFEVPDYHRSKFLNKLRQLPLSVACIQVESEVQQFWSGQSAVLVAINSIKTREAILQSLERFIEQINTYNFRPSIIQLRAIDVLKQLRVSSLNVVEAVKDWQAYSVTEECDFVWKGQKYLEKMQTDHLFIVNSPIKDLVHFEKNCSSLFFYDTKESDTHASISIKTSLLPRLVHAEQLLNKKKGQDTPKDPEKIEKAPENIVSLPTIHRKYEKLTHEQVEYISRSLCEEMIHKISQETLPLVIKTSYNTLLSASLVLFSSKIANRYINESLQSLVLQVAEKGLQEVIDVEYIELQIQLTYLSCETQLRTLVEEIALEEIAFSISEDYSYMINYPEIVTEAIQEEKRQNTQLMNCIYEEMYEEVLREEWFELIIEEVVGNANLDYIWESLPSYVQIVLFMSRPQKINSRLADMIYSDILNHLIGDVWVKSILKAAIRKVEYESLDEIMPIPGMNNGGINPLRALTLT